MAKFLTYEDRLELESGLRNHLSFTEIGLKLHRDRTTIAKEVRLYSVEQCTGYSVFPHNICKYRKEGKHKKVYGRNDCRHPLVTVFQNVKLVYKMGKWDYIRANISILINKNTIRAVKETIHAVNGYKDKILIFL